MTQRGYCTGFFGPMFSGKSSRMLQTLNRVKHAPFSNQTCVVRYAKDIRYSKEYVITHDDMKMKSISATNLEDILPELLKYDNIGIDEAQFFVDAYDIIKLLVSPEHHKRVVFSALDNNYKGEPFGNVCNLLGLCDFVEKCTAVCKSCGDERGIYSSLNEDKVLAQSAVSEDGRIEIIGADELYHTSCRLCFHQKKPRLSASQ